MKPQLKKTKNYSLFTNDSTNRSVEKITKLKDSIKKHGFLPAYPLLVSRLGSKLVIKDGQHRLEVSRALGIEVYYVEAECSKLSIPEINNAQRPWSIRDYACSYANSGNNHYSQLLQFSADTKIPLGICAALISGAKVDGSAGQKLIRSGKFKFGSTDLAKSVVGLSDIAAKHVPWSKHRGFLDALSRCHMAQGFSASRMADRIRSASFLLTLQPNTDLFLDMLDKVYNYRLKDQFPLKFTATQALREKKSK